MDILYWLAEFMDWCRTHPLSVQSALIGATGIVAIRYVYELAMGKRSTVAWWELIFIVTLTHIIRNLL